MENRKGNYRRVIPIKTLLAALADMGGQAVSLRSLAIRVAGHSDPRYGERMVERLLMARYARLIGPNDHGVEAMTGWILMTEAGWARHRQLQELSDVRALRGTRPTVPAVSGALNGRNEASRG